MVAGIAMGIPSLIQLVLGALMVAGAYGFGDMLSKCKGIEKEMNQCVHKTGVDASTLATMQIGPVKFLEMNKQVMGDLCKSGKLSGMVDCVINAMTSKCEGMDKIGEFFNIDGMKDMMTYMCDNYNVILDYKTCSKKDKNAFTTCVQEKAQEMVEKLKDEKDDEGKMAKQICMGFETTELCTSEMVGDCPDKGEHLKKMVSLMTPKDCKSESEAKDTNASCGITISLHTLFTTVGIIFAGMLV